MLVRAFIKRQLIFTMTEHFFRERIIYYLLPRELFISSHAEQGRLRALLALDISDKRDFLSWKYAGFHRVCVFIGLKDMHASAFWIRRAAKRALFPSCLLSTAGPRTHKARPDWIKWNVFFIAIHPPRIFIRFLFASSHSGRVHTASNWRV